ncbi:MAG: hypothetical protein ACR2KL_11305 [Nocardioidaceae bacterium]
MTAEGGQGGGDDVSPELDLRLRDDEVLSEIEMTSNLMIAATEADGPLSQASIDEILGLP